MAELQAHTPSADSKKLAVLALIGFCGLLAEAVGVGLVFAWWQEVPRSLTDPRLVIGSILAFVGFVIIIRGVSWVVKKLILMTIAEN